MVYQMKIYVDGGCRNNGYSNAIAAAAAVRQLRWGSKYEYRKRRVSGRATNQRAELTAIILGLKMALEKYDKLDTSPRINLTIYSDSKYAIGCMTDWIYKWCNNDWTNCQGEEVANRDLIEKASDLDDEVSNLGRVTYCWIPRSENHLADSCCNEELDAMEREQDSDSESDSDSDYYY